jgi:hypothetical protein
MKIGREDFPKYEGQIVRSGALRGRLERDEAAVQISPGGFGPVWRIRSDDGILHTVRAEVERDARYFVDRLKTLARRG